MWIRNSLIAVALLLLSVASLYADGIEFNAVTNGVYGGMSSGRFVGSAPPACSNSLDFSQACNSQYIAVVHR